VRQCSKTKIADFNGTSGPTRRAIPGSGNLSMKTAGNTVGAMVPDRISAEAGAVGWGTTNPGADPREDVDVAFVEEIQDSFMESLCSALAKNTDRVVVADSLGADTGAQFMARILWAGSWLEKQLGVGPSTVVAVTSTNTTWALALRYGAHRLGAVVCHLPFIGADRQSALLDVVNPAVTVTDGTGPMAQNSSWQVHLLPTPFTPLGRPVAQDFTPIHRYRAEDVCILTPSGGTTGVPKASYRTSGNYSRMMNLLPANPSRRQLVLTPFAYIAASQIDQTIIGEGSVILGEHTWTIDRIVDTINAEHPTHTFVVEPALADLLAAAQANPQVHQALGSLHQIMHLGAAAPIGLRQRAHTLFGEIIVHGYAASELGLVSSTIGRTFHPLTAGFLVPGVECQIVDGHDTRVPAGVAGTVVLKTPWKANGYWKRQPDNEFGEWFRTTDQGRLSHGGELTLLGRSGDYLGVTGAHVSDIENLVSLTEGIDYVVVLPDQDDRSVAAIVAQSSRPDARTAIADAVISYSDRIELNVHVFEHIPRTEQGKPDRPAITQLLRNEH
jgi:fatty-acyl-CoA synthase